MPYLRTIASPQLKRRARSTCQSCQRRVFSFERCCPYCSKRNVQFDAQHFERLALCTVDEALRWCERPTGHLEEQMAVVELNDLNLRYCDVCGRSLDDS